MLEPMTRVGHRAGCPSLQCQSWILRWPLVIVRRNLYQNFQRLQWDKGSRTAHRAGIKVVGRNWTRQIMSMYVTLMDINIFIFPQFDCSVPCNNTTILLPFDKHRNIEIDYGNLVSWYPINHATVVYPLVVGRLLMHIVNNIVKYNNIYTRGSVIA